MTGTKSRPTVTVVVPTYNRAASIGDAIDSILAQTEPADQVIVVDDGSTDRTAEVLAPYHGRIEVIRQANGGVSRARNRGIEAATGEWITFLDSDDVWRPNRIGVLLRDVAAATQPFHVHSASLLIEDADFHAPWFAERGDMTPVVMPRGFLFAMRGCHPPGMAVHRDALARGLRFDPALTLAEDTSFFAQAAFEGGICAAPDIVAEARRLANDTVALSRRGRADDSAERIGHELRGYESLTGLALDPGERRKLNDRLALLSFALARVERQDGLAREWARLSQAARLHPSPAKGWIKAVLCVALGPRGYRIATGRQAG